LGEDIPTTGKYASISGQNIPTSGNYPLNPGHEIPTPEYLLPDFRHVFVHIYTGGQDEKLVGKVLSEKNAFWIFSDITTDSFHWENVRIKDDGERFLLCEIFGKRVK
jgi:hypothetical protein